jgi:hypothetical protein
LPYRAPKFGTNIFSKFFDGLMDVPEKTIKGYNRAANLYNQGEYEDCLLEVWGLRYNDGVEQIPQFYELSLELIGKIPLNRELTTDDRKVVSGALLLMEMWNFHQANKGTGKLYDTVVKTAEDLVGKESFTVDGVVFEPKTLLSLLWGSEVAAKRVDDLDLKTLNILKMYGKPEREQMLLQLEQVRTQAEQMVYSNGAYSKETMRLRDMLRYVRRESDKIADGEKVA